jgi:hypothetical protein
MNIRDLDGNLYSWNLTGNIIKAGLETSHKSSYHLKARLLIKEIYPTMQILEEVPIHIRKSEVLYLDFYVPLLKKCIEVHGEQHYAFIPFYHTNKLAFLKAQKRDKEKQEWCEINGIKYIDLPYNEHLDNWKTKIYE